VADDTDCSSSFTAIITGLLHYVLYITTIEGCSAGKGKEKVAEAEKRNVER